MSNNSHVLRFEQSACKFLEELQNIETEIRLLPDNEVKKVELLKFCVKSVIEKVGKEIKEK